MLETHLRAAVRSLRRAPGFAATAALTLALGIGLSTAVFTISNALILRRLPVGDQDRVVMVSGETRDGRFANVPLALKDVRELTRRSRALSSIAFFAFRGATPTPVQSNKTVYPVQVALVSGNFFDVLRSRPIIGRALRSEDDVVGAAPVLVLSHSAWRRRFGGDSTIVGRSITMFNTGRSYAVVGVMPPGLEYPSGTEVWAPLIAYGAAGGFLDIVSGELDIVGRLSPGASSADARDELTTFFARPDAPAFFRDVRGVARPLPNVVFGNTKPAVFLVMVAAALLLVITCVNVANLQIVRALGRMHEFVVRAALGAHRARIVAQLLTESALLAAVGGVLGVVLAIAAVRGFVAIAPHSIPRLDEITVNGQVLATALLIASAAMLLSGVWPALLTSRVDAHDALRSGSRNSGGRRMTAAAELLVVAQVALAATSLAAAGLVTRSFIKLQNAELSFQPGALLVASLAAQGNSASDPATELSTLLKNVEGLTGVQSVSPAYTVPFTAAGGGIDGRLAVPGESKEESARNPILNMEIAAPNYFAMLGIPLLGGRAFSDADAKGSTPVVVISKSVAQFFWPNGDAVGQRLTMGDGHTLSVVGVVPDTRYRELETARPTVYFPVRQSPFGSGIPSTLLIRMTNPSVDITPALRRVVAEADPRLGVVSVASLEALLEGPRARPRLNAIVLTLFATAAATLAAIGLFAIVATMVRQRTHELGIRMALGATARDVLATIMMRGLAIATIGVVIGAVGTFAVGRLLPALLFETSPTDPATLILVAVLMFTVTAVATFVPARLSMRIDPAIALRS